LKKIYEKIPSRQNLPNVRESEKTDKQAENNEEYFNTVDNMHDNMDHTDFGHIDDIQWVRRHFYLYFLLSNFISKCNFGLAPVVITLRNIAYGIHGGWCAKK
jgi:hypothetical protein